MTTQGENQLLAQILEGQQDLGKKVDGLVTSVSKVELSQARVETRVTAIGDTSLDHEGRIRALETGTLTRSTARWLFAAGCTLAGTLGAVASAVLFAIHP